MPRLLSVALALILMYTRCCNVGLANAHVEMSCLVSPSCSASQLPVHWDANKRADHPVKRKAMRCSAGVVTPKESNEFTAHRYVLGSVVRQQLRGGERTSRRFKLAREALDIDLEESAPRSTSFPKAVVSNFIAWVAIVGGTLAWVLNRPDYQRGESTSSINRVTVITQISFLDTKFVYGDACAAHIAYMRVYTSY